MRGTIGIEWSFPKMWESVERAMPEINLFIAATMQTNRGMLFDKEGAYNGHARWAPLKLRSGMILAQRGNLRKSIAPQNATGKPGPDGIVRFQADNITIGTTKAYAGIMNDGTKKLPGGVIRAKNAKALAIPVPQGVAAGPMAKDLQKTSNDARIAAISAKLSKARSPRVRADLRRRIDKLNAMSAKGKGDVKVIFRKSVKIEPRPFDTWTDEDQSEFEVALTNKLVEILNRG